jgi:hypothetical protein
MVNYNGEPVGTKWGAPAQLDLDSFNIQLIRMVDVGGRVYEDLNSAAQEIVNSRSYAATCPESGKVYIFKQVAPPVVAPVHKGFIETTDSRKEVLRYGKTDRYRVIDTTTKAGFDIDANDIKVYFE